MGQLQFTTFRDAEEFAARQGVTLTAKDRERIADLQNAERARIDATTKATGRMDRFNALYAKSLDLLLHITNLAQALARTLIIGVGIPLVLVFLVINEQQRLAAGIGLFEEVRHYADFGAWAVVLLNLGLEFVIHYEDTRRGWDDGKRHAWSLRIAAQNALYRLGIGKTWVAREQPPSAWARRLLRTVTLAILALSLAGSMRDELALQQGKPWHEGFVATIEQSDILLFAAWAGGLLFAAVAVLGAQGLARYIARRTAEIIEEISSEHSTAHDESALDAVATAYLMAKVAKQQQRDQERAAQSEDAFMVPLGTNGNGRH